MAKYYVYAHYTRDTNSLFYIGKGVGGRHKSVHNRSKRWNHIVSLHGFISKILVSDLSLDDSLKVEKDFIELNKELVINKHTPKTRNIYSRDELQDVFEIDETSPSGLVWKRDRENSLGRVRKYKGKVAGSRTGRYWCLEYMGKSIPVHRVIWILHSSTFDQRLDVDHLNGNGFNNKISNLRPVTTSENSRNRILPSKTGIAYVYLRERTVGRPHYLLKLPIEGKRKEYTFYFVSDDEKAKALQACLLKRNELIPSLLEIGVCERVLENGNK